MRLFVTSASRTGLFQSPVMTTWQVIFGFTERAPRMKPLQLLKMK